MKEGKESCVGCLKSECNSRFESLNIPEILRDFGDMFFKEGRVVLPGFPDGKEPAGRDWGVKILQMR